MKISNLRIRGVENPMQSKEVQLKSKHTNMERYGVIYPVQLQQTKDKSKKTCLLKYGVEYPMQNETVSEKSGKYAYRVKEYIFPSGNTIFVQGYEPFALDILIDENINEDDIITSRLDVPEIWYYTDDNKKHRYFTDIYIPSQNRCIEIKSNRTFELEKNEVFMKQKATKEKGFLCEIWILHRNGDIIETYK
jgi:hypothetical protein